MKNKKGFTLIELLAVIVILAIVGAIAVSKISDVIYLSRQKTFKTNAATLISQAIKLYQNEHVGSLNETGIVYEIENGKILVDGVEIDFVEGKIDGTGFIQVSGNGESKIAIENDEFCAVKEFSQTEITIQDKEDVDVCGKVYVVFSYNYDGGSSSQNFEDTYLERTKLTLDDPVKEGYTFVAWEVTKGNSTIKDNILTIGSEDTEISAIWKAPAGADSIAAKVGTGGLTETTATYTNTDNEEVTVDAGIRYVGSASTAATAYLQERGITQQYVGNSLCTAGTTYCNDKVNRTTTWTGLVGLMSVSDIRFANGWLYNGTIYPWAITPDAYSSRASGVWGSLSSSVSGGYASNSFGVWPSVILKSNIQILGGDGLNTPYKLSA